MEQLRNYLMGEDAGSNQEYTITEKDFGEGLTYDLKLGEVYLGTLGFDGKILYINWSACEATGTTFSILARLRDLIGKGAIKNLKS